MTKTNKDWVEKTIKEMWKARVVNYDPYLEKDQVYKEGWEQGFRFALYKKDQQHKQKLEAQREKFLDMLKNEIPFKKRYPR